jgi:hypothetical protein
MKKAEDQERDEATRQGTSTVVVVVVVVFNLPPAPSPTLTRSKTACIIMRACMGVGAAARH